MKYEIRELDIGGILDQAIKVLKDKFVVLFSIICILQLPVNLFYAISMAPYQLNLNNPEATRPPDQNYLIILGIFMLLSMIVTPLTNAAMIYAISDTYLGKQPTIKSSFSRALSRFGPLLLTMILLGFIVFGASLLCLVPGILCAIWFALAPQIVVLEPLSGFAALKRSKELMKNNIGKWIVLILILAAITVGFGTAAVMIGLISSSTTVILVLNTISQTFTSLFGFVVMVIFYFSARCTHENFDLELLAASFDTAQPSEGDSADAGEGDF